jgi:hypothetical protein
MYELISIPKRNTTAVGVIHFMRKFLMLISYQTPAIDRLWVRGDWRVWQSRTTAASVPPAGVWAHHGTLNPAS